MAFLNKMLNIMPYHCRYCDGGFLGMVHISDEAKAQGLFLTELKSYDAEKGPVWSTLGVEDPIFVNGFGHGNKDVYTGDSETPIFTSSECSILSGRVIYLLSCYTGARLGPAIIAAGGIAYGGYKIAWTWMVNNSHIDPYDDRYAEPFYRSSNEFPIALIQGEPVFLARDRCIAEYNRWIDIWETERRGDPYSAAEVKWLLHDRDGLTVLGDTSTTIVAAGTPTSMAVDVEPPASANSGETFPFAGRLLEKDTGSPLAGKTINLRVDGGKITTITTGDDGGWTFDATLTAGIHRLYAEFLGDDEYAPGYTREYVVEVGLTKMIVTVVPPTSVDPGVAFPFSGVLMSGTTGVPNKPINLWQAGVDAPIATTTTADDGSWHFDVILSIEGHYRLYVEFPGDDEYMRTLTGEYMVAVGVLPAFGCTEVGTHLAGIVGKIEGFVFECPEDGEAESISVYLQAGSDPLGRVKCAIYRKDDYSLVGVTEERVFKGGRFFDWRTFLFPTPPMLTAETKYILIAWASAAADVFMVPGDPGQRLQLLQSPPYNDFPDPFNFQYSFAYKAAIYCSYRPTVAPKHTLAIKSSPINGVSVKVDGKPVGGTPTSTPVVEGERTVEVPGEVET